MTPNSIRYVVGDATAPEGTGPRVIVHICNDVGRWGKGFVKAISKRWAGPREQFLAWHRGELKDAAPFELGRVRFVEVESALWVANLIGQHGLKRRKGIPPVRYEAIGQGLEEVARFARKHDASVHMPRIGCGLAGGSWEFIGSMVTRKLVALGIPVTVYDLEAPCETKTTK